MSSRRLMPSPMLIGHSSGSSRLSLALETTVRLVVAAPFALLAAIDRLRMHRASTTIIRLAKGDVYRVPRYIRSIRIVSGWAWLSSDGHDIVLAPQQQMAFTTNASTRDITLVSGLEQLPLVFEATQTHGN